MNNSNYLDFIFPKVFLFTTDTFLVSAHRNPFGEVQVLKQICHQVDAYMSKA